MSLISINRGLFSQFALFSASRAEGDQSERDRVLFDFRYGSGCDWLSASAAGGVVSNSGKDLQLQQAMSHGSWPSGACADAVMTEVENNSPTLGAVAAHTAAQTNFMVFPIEAHQ